MTDLVRISATLLGIAYREGTSPRDAERLKGLAVRLRNAHDVLQRVGGAVAARQQNRRLWAALREHHVPTSDVSASPRLLHPMAALGCRPTPRAIRYALKALLHDFEPRDVPYAELLALRRFLEAQLPEET